MGLTSFGGLFDPYERKARLFPGLLVGLPIGLTILSLAGSVDPWMKILISVMVSCGTPFLLASISRDVGKKLEEQLFTKWGGMPSTQLLRHADMHFDAHTKRRYHAILEAGSKVNMPSPEKELTDPYQADEAYKAAGVWLRSQTRNTKAFPHIFRENVAYGFRRNATGLKPIGLIISILCITTLILRPIYQTILADNNHIEALFSGVGIFQGAILIAVTVLAVIWAVCFSEESLRRSALAYADRLIRSCDELKKPRSKKSQAAPAITS